MNGPDLETRLRSYYETCQPKDSARLMVGSRTVLDDARRSRPRFALWGGLRLAATLAIAVALLAVLVLPRLGSVVVPAAQSSFDPATAANASLDQAGLMRSGGIWAVAGSYLLTSTDNGASWRAGDLPDGDGAGGKVFVLEFEPCLGSLRLRRLVQRQLPAGLRSNERRRPNLEPIVSVE